MINPDDIDQQKGYGLHRLDRKQATLYQKQREHIKQAPATRVASSDQCLYSVRSDIFSLEDVNKIIEAGDNTEKSEATIYQWGSKVNHDVRKTDVGWLTPPEDIPSLLPNIIKIWEGKYRHFEMCQYGSYSVGGHFNWHRDTIKTPMTTTKRVSAAVIQLSDPSEYEGGFLEIDDGKEIVSIEKKQGLVLILPVDLLHRVTPLTWGLRKSLVIWALGDRYPDEELNF